MTAANVTLWALLAVIAVLILIVVGTYNGMVRARIQVREAWSGIDVQLRRRASFIPNLVEAVKGYAGHEREVFVEVAQARSGLQQAGGAAEAASANAQLTQALGRLFAVVESYPQLRANENFMALEKDLADAEDKISFARQFYNRNALDYNTRIQTFPAALLARTAGFAPVDFFETADEGRAEVRVSFAPPSGSPPQPPDPPRPPSLT